MSNEAYVIVNIAGIDMPAAGHPWPTQLPLDRCPTALLTRLEDAKAQLRSLARDNPAGRYVLFVATHMAVTVATPTSVALTGQPVTTHPVQQIAAIAAEPELRY